MFSTSPGYDNVDEEGEQEEEEVLNELKSNIIIKKTLSHRF